MYLTQTIFFCSYYLIDCVHDCVGIKVLHHIVVINTGYIVTTSPHLLECSWVCRFSRIIVTHSLNNALMNLCPKSDVTSKWSSNTISSWLIEVNNCRLCCN